jgi:ribosomal protein S18 acetylase RimI-like enzyme
MLTRRLPPPAGWVLRPAEAADAPVLAQLCIAHAAYEHIAHNPEGHAQRLAEALETGGLLIWLGLLEGKAVGYASATHDFSTLAARPFLHLDCLYLEAHARGLGLGGMLVEAVWKHATGQGYDQMQWQTPNWNAAAIRFYDRLGATRLDKQRYTLNLAAA